MKAKLFLVIVMFISFLIACNQTKKTNEKEPETKEVQQEELTEPITAKGKIVNSETGDEVGMAIIIVKGTTTGTMSGPNGEFVVQAPAGAKKLVFSADGYETLEVDIDGKREMEVKLIPKSEEIEQ